MAGDFDDFGEDEAKRRVASDILAIIDGAEEPAEIPPDKFTKTMAATGWPAPSNHHYLDREPQALLCRVQTAIVYDRSEKRYKPLMANEKPRIDRFPVSSPFAVTHALRYFGEGHREGLRIAVQPGYRPSHGLNRVEVDISRGDLVDQKAYMRLLMDAGLRPHDKRAIAKIIELAQPRDEILILPSPGWYVIPKGDGGRPVFACPDGEPIGEPGMGIKAELDPGVVMDKAIARAGKLERWKKAVAAAFEYEDAPHFALGVMAGFAGAVLSLAGLPSAGLVFTGTTSRGKSTAQALAVSAWSAPDMGKPGLLQSALSTANAVEMLLSRGNGTVLALDELALMRGEDQGRLIFEIYSGSGKQRMRAEGGLREVASWRTFALLSNERKLADSVREAGGKWTPGAELRLLDIDVSTVRDDLPVELFATLEGIRSNYGFAGPAFVQALFEHGFTEKAGELRELIKRKARELAGSITDNQAKAERAALGLACVWVAGDLAKGFELFPNFAEPELSVRWAWSRFFAEADVLEGNAEDRAIAALELWIKQRWSVSIKKWDGASAGVREAEGWYFEPIPKGSQDTKAPYPDGAVLIPADKLTAAAGGMLPQKALAEVLDSRGLIARKDNNGRLTCRLGGRNSRLRVYALDYKTFGGVIEPDKDQQ